jgi:photosystem II stability/assembly factor-like uncharacterized protein
MKRPVGLSLACFLAFIPPAPAQPVSEAPPDVVDKLLDTLVPRPIGPANMGGRIVDVAVVESRPATMYAATASGGLWKTVNNGTTWAPIFDNQNTVSIGDIAVAPSNPEIVWVGTGESNARNSVSWGDGVYKSTDGGKTWQHVGLKDSAHVGRIVIHPTNPDVVYVAALGRLWGPNKERGLFKTSDGGKTWQPSKVIDENTGFIDVAMDPGAPDTLYAAAYHVRRDAFSGGNPAVQTGPGAGLFKTTDGGKTWRKMTKGLPDRPLGRCGFDVYRKDPRVVYAVVQTDKTVVTVAGQPAKKSADPATGGVFRSDDKGESWTKLNDLCPRPFYYGQIRIDPHDDQRIYVLGIALHVSDDGGKTFRNNGAPSVHADHHALWIDPRDSHHLVLGCDGGLNFSYDRAATWAHLNNLPIGQFYAIGLDTRKPYRVYGGLQDNGSWGGPSATRRREGITNADWSRILGADGFYCQVDPTNPNVVYAESQYGGLHRLNVRTGDDASVRPQPAKGAPAYRFNWQSPVLISPHNARTIYYGGNHVFRSPDRGDHWQVISPDLTHGKPGPDPSTGHTVTTLAESPLRAGHVYAGTDDGRLHVTRDGGATWTDLSATLPDVPADRWISRLECSHFAEDTAYLTIDRHRNDDRAPYVFRTIDAGKTWQPLAHNLPHGEPLHVIREDPRNRDLLFVGTEFGLFVSINGGARWHRVRTAFPTVAVHDLAVQARERELVLGTHGRSIYVLDILPLEELTPAVLAAPAHLFDVKPATVFNFHGSHSGGGVQAYAAPNPPYGAVLHYYLRDPLAGPAAILITDALGNRVAELRGKKEAGLHQALWNLRVHRGGNPDDDEPAPPGDYVARLRAGDLVVVKRIRVEAAADDSPAAPAGGASQHRR